MLDQRRMRHIVVLIRNNIQVKTQIAIKKMLLSNML